MFYIDTREQDEHLLRYAKDRGWVEKTLSCGDFETPQLIFERKTFKDLFQSIRQPRFLAQIRKGMEYCVKHSKTFIYIIEGDINDTAKVIRKEKGFKYNFSNKNEVLARIMDLTISFGLPVLFTENQLETVRTTTRYADRGRTTENRIFHIPPDKIPKHLPDIVKALMSVSGIGQQTAEEIATKLPAKHIGDLMKPLEVYTKAGIKKRGLTMLNNNQAFHIEDNL